MAKKLIGFKANDTTFYALKSLSKKFQGNMTLTIHLLIQEGLKNYTKDTALDEKIKKNIQRVEIFRIREEKGIEQGYIWEVINVMSRITMFCFRYRMKFRGLPMNINAVRIFIRNELRVIYAMPDDVKKIFAMEIEHIESLVNNDVLLKKYISDIKLEDIAISKDERFAGSHR